jgi:oligosaccharide repeat unit polymerase
MRLFFLYFFIWLAPLTSGIWYVSEFNVGISYQAILYISLFILLLFIFTLLMSLIFLKKASIESIAKKFDINRSISFQSKLTTAWILIFITETIFSGGLPVFWAGKGYESFGIPTIHGISNMIRGFMLSNISLLLILKFDIPKRLIFISFFTLFSALVLEQSRGAFILTLCFGLGPIILFMNIGLKNIFKTILAIIFVVPLFSVFQFLRYAESPIEEFRLILELASYSEEAYKYFLEPIINYIASPVLNAGLNIDNGQLINFAPATTIYSLVPGFIAGELFTSNPEEDYGLLINEAFNTTTFITPFILDYGLLGAIIIIGSFLFFSSYVYARAKAGSIKHIIAFSAISACIILSIFTSYITSLVIIIYLLLSGVSARRMMRL